MLCQLFIKPRDRSLHAGSGIHIKIMAAAMSYKYTP
jgi:hypothetical protein